MTNTNNIKTKEIKVGYYSMGLSSILAGVLLVLNQIGHVPFEGLYVLWPAMMILLGLEVIAGKIIASVKRDGSELKPAWGILFICSILVGCSQIWIMLLNSTHIIW